MKNYKKRISFDAALATLQKYCAYRERCTFEVNERLNKFLLKDSEKAKIVAQLKEAGFLNNRRFAEAFAHGKFYFKKWGRLRLRNELKQKNIDEALIEKVLQTIPEKDYKEMLTELATKKLDALKESGLKNIELKAKLSRFLINKGYEYDLVYKKTGELLP